MKDYPSWLRWVLWLLPLAIFYAVRAVADINVAIILGGSALAFAFYMDMRHARLSE